MSNAPWVKWYPGDFLNGISGRTANEIAVYTVILNLIYDKNGPITDEPDEIARRCRMRLPQCTASLQTLARAGKIIRADGLIDNQRTRKEIGRRHERSMKATSNANLRWDKEKEKPPKINGTSMQTHPQENADAMLARSQKPEAREAVVADDDAARVALAVEVGKKVTDLMGVTEDPRWLGNWSMVQAWLNEGFSPEADILPTVTTIVQKLKLSGRSMPKTLNYFTGAIRENSKVRRGPDASPAGLSSKSEFFEVKAGTPAFRAWISNWKAQGRKTGWVERQKSITVPSEFPPQEHAA